MKITDARIISAKRFAIHAHGNINQRRKYTSIPYVFHSIEVANLVIQVTDDPSMIAAAFLHDVVEDTAITLTTIHSLFGVDVGNLVDELTDISKLSDGNRATRKAIDRDHTAQASSRAKTIKLADTINNLSDIIFYDKTFSRIYMKEKALLLPKLKDGDSVLYAQTQNLLDAGQNSLV